MSTLLRPRRMFMVSQVAGGSDTVFAGVWLPAGSILTRVRGEVALTGPSEITLGQTVAYAIEGWILPVEDPDSVVTMNALWDSHVPKDLSTFVLDLDADAADSNPFYEPGEIAWEFLFDVGLTPQRILHRHKLCSAANAALGFRQDTETPFVEHWFAGAVEKVDIARPLRVSAPSLVVFAVAAPDTSATSATSAVAAIDENDWGRIKYVDHVMEQAMLDLLGLVEAGAETPFEDAAILLKDYLAPLVLENNAAVFQNKSWLAAGELTFDVVVPGRMANRVLTAGR